MKRRGTAIVVAAALCAPIAAVGPQAIADGGAKSRVKIRSLSASGISGVVRSKKNRCERKREVSVFQEVDFVNEKIGVTKSNSRGKWELEKSLEPGSYFAKIAAKSGCRYAVSRTERF